MNSRRTASRLIANLHVPCRVPTSLLTLHAPATAQPGGIFVFHPRQLRGTFTRHLTSSAGLDHSGIKLIVTVDIY